MEIRSLAVVGGASAYTPGLALALLHHAGELALREIRLYDLDEENLAIVGRLVQRMSAAAGDCFTVSYGTNLEEALQGVDAVLNSSRPGGLECRRLDETLPLQFDIPGQETVGPGGFFFALRSVPEAHRVADVLVRVSPEALFINYTNPSNIVTQALLDRGDVQAVGLCDQSDEDLHSLAEALGLAGQPVSFCCVGLNHATWYSGMQFGETALSELELPEELPMPRQIDAEHELRFRCSESLAKQFAPFWPNSYLPYYFEPELFVEHSRRVGPRTDAIRSKLSSYYRHFREEAAKEAPEVRLHRGSAGFGDLAVSLLRALEEEGPAELVLNVRNAGMTPLFREDTVVEGRLPVSAAGIRRVELPAAPESQQKLLEDLERYQRLTAAAASGGTMTQKIEALSANPLVPGRGVAEQMLKAAKEVYPAGGGYFV